MLLRNPPRFKYSGLTIVLSKPSRHDLTQLLTGVAGHFFNEECLLPETNLHCCDVRLADDKSPLLADTKAILLLGAKSFATYVPNSNLTLDEGRGSPFLYDNKIYVIPSFSAQDAIDPKDYESSHNEEEEMDTEEGHAGELFEEKSRGSTARSNYRFWLKADTKKALRILNNYGQIPKLYASNPNYIIAPSLDRVCTRLNETRNSQFYFDMETDFISMDMRCFGFSFGDDPFNIYVVPTLTTDYKPYYGKDQHLLYRNLYRAIRNNRIVSHNGSQFDFLVLAIKYRIAICTAYDTMLAQHKVFPTVEKSLGHLISYYLYEIFHKNEGAHGYHNLHQAESLYKYCGKDIFTMYLIHKEQEKLASCDEGLRASIQQSNDAIKPYLTTTLLGMHYDDLKRQEWLALNDRLMTQYIRIMTSLTGGEIEPLISNKKCTRYFHEMLGYPVVGRSKKTNAASLSEDNLYKLALKVGNNPVIKFLIKYRQIQKASGTLNFKAWINRNNNTITI